MLTKKIKNTVLGRVEVVTFPRYFKHFKEEIHSSILFEEDEPMLIIKINGKVMFIRKRRISMKYKFYENGIETTLEEISKKIKTLLEFKEFLAGAHKVYTIVDYREDKPYTNVRDLFKRARFIEYAMYNMSMIPKRDRKAFEPENVGSLSERKVLKYFSLRIKMRLKNISNDEFLDENGLLYFDLDVQYWNGAPNDKKRFIFLKGKYFNEGTYEQMVLMAREKGHTFNFEPFIKSQIVKFVCSFNLFERKEDMFCNMSKDDYIGIEPTDESDRYSRGCNYYLSSIDFPYYMEVYNIESRIISKDIGKIFLTFNHVNAFESKIIETF
ncbi:MAG: hypothetical protein ACRCTZ_08355 [Sarcina sp.]